jgi:putative oxidoreductase
MNSILSPTANPKESLRDIAFDLPGRFPIARWAPIPLRLIVGFGFMEHGFAKLSKSPGAFAAILHALAVPAPHFVAWITILTELLGGLAILLGAFVPLVSLPMAALLLVAIFTVHLPYGFSSIKLIAVTATGAQFGPPGYECDLLYLACLAALVLGGSGPWAIDGLLRKNRRTLKHKRHHDWSFLHPLSESPAADEHDTASFTPMNNLRGIYI